MATLDPRLVQWVAAVIGADGTPSEVRGPRDGGGPWLLRFNRQDVGVADRIRRCC